MGAIIDLEKVEIIYRCNHVKRGIVWINLIGPPISLLFLTFGITRMFLVKKRKSLLTNIIILIFFSEIIQCLSKLIQLLKYTFPDRRDDKNFYDGNTPRGVICQIQITTAIFSDFCSLLNTLLLSLRCYDVIKNKKRFFDKGNNGIITIIGFIFLSLILAIIFIIIDNKKTHNNISYRYDLRDRCSYWCWLEHLPSLICLGLYWIILFFNIYFACKTNSYLKSGYKKIKEENQLLPAKTNDNSTPSSEENSDNSSRGKNKDKEDKKNQSFLTAEEKKRIEQLKLMRLKCQIYPYVTIFYWLFAATYRIVDDSFMWQFDSSDEDPYTQNENEKKLFDNHPGFHALVQFCFVAYTFLSSIRGILYGFSFLVFEEKIFFNFFKKCFKRCYKEEDSDSDEDDESRLVRNTNSTSISDMYVTRGKEEQKDESNYQTIEMRENNYDNEKDNENDNENENDNN